MWGVSGCPIYPSEGAAKTPAWVHGLQINYIKDDVGADQVCKGVPNKAGTTNQEV